MSDFVLEVEERHETGKNVNRRLRAAGKVPAVVYGGDRAPTPIQVERRDVERLMRSAENENIVFLLKLAGTERTRHTMVRALDYDPVTRAMLHIDFQRVDLSQPVRVTVPLETVGVAPGVKVDGGLVDFVTREIEVECLPNQIPGHVSVDISSLELGQHVEASALTLPEGVALLTDAERVILSITGSAMEIEEEEGDGEDVEPEVIARGKAEED
ncbi:MAG: 50S ribosomal protein L25 [Acidobacteriota bacterium]